MAPALCRGPHPGAEPEDRGVSPTPPSCRRDGNQTRTAAPPRGTAPPTSVPGCRRGSSRRRSLGGLRQLHHLPDENLHRHRSPRLPAPHRGVPDAEGRGKVLPVEFQPLPENPDLTRCHWLRSFRLSQDKTPAMHLSRQILEVSSSSSKNLLDAIERG